MGPDRPWGGEEELDDGSGPWEKAETKEEKEPNVVRPRAC